MPSLTEISSDHLRSLKGIESLCGHSNELSIRLNHDLSATTSNGVLAASRIAQKMTLQGYNWLVPESRQQGVLASIYDLQQRVQKLGAYSSVSLAASNRQMGVFSCLSMMMKYHQKKKQLRNRLLLINRLDDVALVAGQLNLTLQFTDPLHITDYLDEQCAALVVSLPAINDKLDFIESIRSKLQQMDIPLYVDGSGQYLLTHNTAYDGLKADILHLDLGYICGLDKGANAVLANEKFADYLPLPIAGFNGEAYQWKTLQQNPLSIGMLNDSPLDLQQAMHCLIYLRMQGEAAMQQQALQSIVMARYIKQKLVQSGLILKNLPETAGACVIDMNNRQTDAESLEQLLTELTRLPIRLQLNPQQGNLNISLTNLHQLNFDQMQRMLEMFILHHQKIAAD